MKKNIFETLVGGVVAVVAFFLLYFAYIRTQNDNASGYHISASFNRTDGLSVGSDIKMSGIKIGKVVQMTLDPKTYQAEVMMSIDPNVKLPHDSSAAIVSESLLGGKFLDIIPGGEDKMLQDQGVINYTQSSVNFESLIGKMIFSNDDARSS